MKNILKIVIGISILFLLLGVVSAKQEDNLKAPDDYENIVAGMSARLDNKDIYFYVGEMEYNKDVFENTSDYTATKLEDNIYKFGDTKLNDCGVQKKVKLDGKDYLVSIIDESSADGDINSYLTSLKEFNEINNLMPITI